MRPVVARLSVVLIYGPILMETDGLLKYFLDFLPPINIPPSLRPKVAYGRGYAISFLIFGQGHPRKRSEKAGSANML